jgi:hypothetical protein
MAKIISLNDANKSIGSTLSADEELKQFEKKIILASVDKSRTISGMFRGILLFPTDTALREARLGNKFILYLDELIDKNCKKCYGRGITGDHPITPNFIKETNSIISQAVTDKNLTQDVTTELCKLGIEPNVLENFIRELQQEFDRTGKVNVKAVTMLSKHLREYLVKFFPMYCTKCLMPAYNKKLTELQQEAKFAI